VPIVKVGSVHDFCIWKINSHFMGLLDFGTIKSNYFMSFCLKETKIKIRTQPIC